MAAVEPGKIRNVAVAGHRGTGKTSLVEAMLFQAGAVNRLGSIEQGSTVADWDEDEQRRQMSISATLCHLEWQGRKINLIDTPGEPSFQGETISSLRVVEGTLIVVSARHGRRGADEQGLGAVRGARPGTRPLREHARPRACRLLPRPRAAAEHVLEPLRRRPSPDRGRARGQRDRRPAAHEGVHEPRGRQGVGAGRDSRGDVRPGGEVPRTAPRLGGGDGRGPDGAIPRGPGALGRGGRARAERCGDARRDLPRRLRGRDEEPRDDRDARPARRGRPVAGEEGLRRPHRRRGERRLRLQDGGRPVRRPHQRLPRDRGQGRDGLDARELALAQQGAGRPAADAPGQGSRPGRRVRPGRPRRGGEAEGRADRRSPARQGDRRRAAVDRVPRARDELRDLAEGEGRRGEARDRAPAPPRGGPDARSCDATSRPASSCCRASRRCTSRWRSSA